MSTLIIAAGETYEQLLFGMAHEYQNATVYGTLLDSAADESATVTIANGGTVTRFTVLGADIAENSSDLVVSQGGTASAILVGDGGWFTLENGSICEDVSLVDGGYMLVKGALTQASGITVTQGELSLQTSAQVSDVVLDALGKLKIPSGTTATDVVMYGGSVEVVEGLFTNLFALDGDISLKGTKGGTILRNAVMLGGSINDGSKVAKSNQARIENLYLGSDASASFLHNPTFCGTTTIAGVLTVAKAFTADNLTLVFQNTQAATFTSQSLVSESVIVDADALDAGDYILATGISRMGTSVTVRNGGVDTARSLNASPYVDANQSDTVQKVGFADGALSFALADTLYCGVHAEEVNGFDCFTNEAEMNALYGTAFTGKVYSVAYVTANATMDDLVDGTTANLIRYDADQTQNAFSAHTLARDVKFEGNGVDATAVTAGVLYAGGNSLALKDIAWTGNIYGGVKNGMVAGVDLALENVRLAKDLYGAGVAATDDLAVEEDVIVELTDVRGGVSYYGAGFANGGDIEVGGCVRTVISGGEFKGIYSGANMGTNAQGREYVVVETSLVIHGGTFDGIVGNGGIVRAGQSSLQGDCGLEITGGTFQSYVYGGAFAYGTGSKSTTISAGTATIEGDIQLAISGGTFYADVFGGSLASNSHIATANTEITGDVTISLDAKRNTIALNGNLIAGSLGKGAVNGNTTIVVSGVGENLLFGEDSCITGTSEYGTTINSYVSGYRMLSFDGFTGAFEAHIGNGAFDTLTVTGASEVTLERADLTSVETWNLEVNSTFGVGTLNLAGDALVVSGTCKSDAQIANAQTIVWDENTTVSLFGENAVATTNGVWESDSYRLTADVTNGVLVVGRC